MNAQAHRIARVLVDALEAAAIDARPVDYVAGFVGVLHVTMQTFLTPEEQRQVGELTLVAVAALFQIPLPPFAP